MNTGGDNVKNGFLSFLKYLGPGIITAALVFGPGSLTIASKLGASFQFSLLWIVVMATFFMAVFTSMASNIGASSDITLIKIINKKYGRIFSYFAGIGIFLVTASFQSGNSIGAGLAFAELFNTSLIPWIIVFSVLAISLLFFRSFYKILEKIMIVMIVIMLISFLITLLLSAPEISAIFKGFIPDIPSGSELLVIALIASSFSMVGAFYQSYLVKERGWKRNQASLCRKEGLAGIILLGMVTFMIMSAAGSVLFPKGIQVSSAAEMGKALEPLFGNIASSVFMIGLFAASFSSLLGNATIGGAILADTFSIGDKLNDLSSRVLIMLVIITGSTLAIVFSHLQLQLIVLAQAITMIVSPVIGIFIFLIANDEKIMGKNKNGIWLKLLGILGLLLVITLGISFSCNFLF
ncbi:MAG: Nramp family divalent metal transporter [Cyclobacteriaceae bacterium]|jgi:Mn2+/Fe2+ NRAMP family transporter